MTMDEKIEEMEIDIIKTFSVEYIYALNETMKKNSDIKILASSLIAKGYRKESDTAREILTELLDFVNGWFEGVEYNDFGVEFNRISKDLAEKYGVDLGE